MEGQTVSKTIRITSVALHHYFMQIRTLVQMQFAGYIMFVSITEVGLSVFAPVPGQDPTVWKTVRFYSVSFSL